MVLTVLEAQVPPGQESALQAAYEAAAAGALPAGLVRSELLRDRRDATRWRIQTWWTSREALEAMRTAGTPAGVLMFRAAGVEPVLQVFDVVSTLSRDAS
ncbi:MAG TPA: antibiotic biosynthesis monooxygenase [Gemmatimonadaceae bacterium]